jgi:hypothetical protein
MEGELSNHTEKIDVDVGDMQRENSVVLQMLPVKVNPSVCPGWW